MIDAESRALATGVLAACRARQWTVATAESCTGGLVAGALTEIAGSSDVVDRGFITYSNAAKMALLGVPDATLAAHGAVSRQTAEAMARGTLGNADADLAVAVTGIAGPGGGTPEKPVGTVCIAVVVEAGGQGEPETRRSVRTFPFFGGREMVKFQAAQAAMNMLRLLLLKGSW